MGGKLRYALGVAGCLLLPFFPFVRGQRVPLLGGVDLGFHELGHMLTYWLPEPVTALMGSVTQVAVPLGLAAYFLWRREFVGAGLCLSWAGASAWDVSVYVADAPYERLPLIGGDHDWAYLMSRWDAMEQAAGVASVVRALGLVSSLTGLALCAAAPWLEARSAHPPSQQELPDGASPPSGGWAIIPPWEQEGGS